MEKITQQSWKERRERYLPYIFILLGILFLYNVVVLWQTGQEVTRAVAEIETGAIPLDVELTVISAADCADCFNISSILAVVEAQNVNITKQKEIESASEEAQTVIAGYNIEKLPAVILTGEFRKKETVTTALETVFEKISDNVLLFEASSPPYYNVSSDEVIGRVVILSLTAPQCKECQDIAGMIPGLKKVLTITSVEEIEYNAAEAEAHIASYAITAVPTIIISADAAAYEGFAEAWKRYGSQEEDGFFVLRQAVPPYLDPETGDVKGIVDVIYLTDDSCADCYDVSIHKQVISGFGVVFGEEETVDISSDEGQALLEKYGITKVPTVILSADAEEYAAVEQVWSQVGKIADDGSLIFTSMEKLQDAVYTDLEEK